MSFIPIYRPYTFLRCKRCGRKTDHVLTEATTERDFVRQVYECQECGEAKRVYEPASAVEHPNPTQTRS